MRKGNNPFKDKKLEKMYFTHQVIIPVFIPELEAYFKDSLKILKISISSLIKTCHENTFITVVNNGSCQEVMLFLNELMAEGNIHEVIHTSNIGKINAVLKGAAGQNTALVTIADADVLFLNNWQTETVKVFNNVEKAGVVGLIPQFFSYQYNCENFLFDNFWNKRVYFNKIKNPGAMEKFYQSLGWDTNYPKDRLKYALSFNGHKGFKAILGTGHVVSTFRREIIDQAKFVSEFKMGGDSEASLDQLPSRLGYAAFTAYDNYAYHMGNVWEEWMGKELDTLIPDMPATLLINTLPRSPFKLEWKVKKKIMGFFFKKYKLRMIFLRLKGLPKSIRDNF